MYHVMLESPNPVFPSLPIANKAKRYKSVDKLHGLLARVIP